MEVVFKYDSYRTVTDPDLANVRFPSAETFIATKAAAALVKKRRRDAFDVYVTVADQEPKLFAQSWSNLVRADGLFRDANDALWQAVWQLDSLPKIRSVLAELRAPALPSEKTIQEAFGFLTDPSMNPHM
ncbi:hypothetical protein BE17_40235 [Sorangium cellulosum]|uniref:Uncharacterized protein n=1 Tax=Sorangium cellulosum TaxID=56 RepID=A0A150S425_SORCE|nr:hypothetical protein BE17_40235 [Sorangium cellulosum]